MDIVTFTFFAVDVLLNLYQSTSVAVLIFAEIVVPGVMDEDLDLVLLLVVLVSKLSEQVVLTGAVVKFTCEEKAVWLPEQTAATCILYMVDGLNAVGLAVAVDVFKVVHVVAAFVLYCKT